MDTVIGYLNWFVLIELNNLKTKTPPEEVLQSESAN